MSIGLRLTTALQRRLVPELEYSQRQFERYLGPHVAAASSWLELGCGHRLLDHWSEEAERRFVAQCPMVVGLDYDFDAIRRHRSIRDRCRGDAASLPFRDAAFDLVTSNMVVEHLSDPARQFAEIARVLRPGGAFVFHTPNASSFLAPLLRFMNDDFKRVLARVLEGRIAEDVYPTHYRANRPSDIAEAAARSGFTVEDIRLVSTFPVTGRVPPAALVELLVIRLLHRPSLARYRTNLFCTLRRTGGPGVAGGG